MTTPLNRLFYKPGFDRPLETPQNIADLLTPNKKKAKVASVEKTSILQFDEFVNYKYLINSKDSNVNGYDNRRKDRSTADNLQDLDQHDVEMMTEENATAKYFTPIDKFQSAELDTKREILTISVDGFPDSTLHSSYLAEDLINTVIQTAKELKIDDVNGDVNPYYTWSFNNSDYLETKTLFIRFEDILTLYLFVALSDDLEYEGAKSGLSQKITIHMNRITRQAMSLLEEQLSSIKSIETSDSKEIIRKRISKLHSFPAKLTSSSGTGNIDQLLAMYSKDKIDPQELIAVPSEMVDTIKQNIVDFRTHVLRIEKQKREQQMLKEKRKSKIRLKEMVSNLRNSNGIAASYPLQHDDVSSDEEDTPVKDEITDEEHEAKKKAAEENRVSRMYSQRLQSARKRDAVRRETHANFMKAIRNDVYINNVIPEARDKFVNLFVKNITDDSNTMDKNRSYYVNHSNYLSHRNNKRIDEERQDQKDREEEKKESSASEDTQEFMSTFEPVKIVFKKKDQDAVSNTISETLIPEIEKKVEDVIEEYLGMKEESLVTFILNYVKSDYFTGKDTEVYKSFMNELSETLDEDADTAMSDIFSFIEGLL